MAAAEGRGSAGPLSTLVGSRLFKPLVFLACLAPGAQIGYNLYTGNLGVDPLKTLLHDTGITALGVLFASLSVTPLRRLLGVPKLQNVRRMIGVWAFVYALLHLSTYLVFDRLCYSVETCQFRTIWDDVTQRRFIFVGMAAFAILLSLALTSTKGWQRRLRRNWTRLHRLVYVAAGLGVIHYAWIQKSDYSDPLTWAAGLLVLLGLRVFYVVRGRQARAQSTVTA